MSIIHPDGQVDEFALSTVLTILRRERSLFEANARQCGGDIPARARQDRIVHAFATVEHDLTEILGGAA